MVIETSITKMFGIKVPILNAPIGPFLSNDIAIAVCEAGGLGVVSHSGGIEHALKMHEEGTTMAKIIKDLLEMDYMERSLDYVVERTDKPFGFNIRTSRNEIDAIKQCEKLPEYIMENPKLKKQVQYIVTSAGSARMLQASKSFQKLKEETDIKHFHVAPALWLADKCVAAGVDGLVCTGGEGGGHQSYEKVSTLVLLQQVRRKYPDLPLLACGGFGSGEGLAAAVAMGAGGIVMGSRFIASKEAEFNEIHKNVIPPAKAGDTRLVTGMLGPIRLWKNKYCMAKNLVGSKEELISKENATSPEQLKKEYFHYFAILDGEIEDSAVLLGQSIGLIDSVDSINDILSSIANDAERLIKTAAANIK